MYLEIDTYLFTLLFKILMALELRTFKLLLYFDFIILNIRIHSHKVLFILIIGSNKYIQLCLIQ